MLTCGLLFAQSVITPALQIEVNGTAKDLVLHDNHLLIGTDSGRLQVYDYEAKKFVKEIKIPDIKDFTGEVVPAAVFSVDYDEGRYLLLSDSGEGGYSNLWVHENNQTTQLISPKDQKPLIKARFVDKDHVLLGYLGNEAALFDIRTKKEGYRVQLSESKFSDFALSEDKSQAVFSCESGILYLIEVKSGKVINAEVQEKGTLTPNTQLRSLAIKAAMASVFDAKPDAPEVQIGTIEYVFIIGG